MNNNIDYTQKIQSILTKGDITKKLFFPFSERH